MAALLIKNWSVEHDHGEDHEPSNDAPCNSNYFSVSCIPKHVKCLKISNSAYHSTSSLVYNSPNGVPQTTTKNPRLAVFKGDRCWFSYFVGAFDPSNMEDFHEKH